MLSLAVQSATAFNAPVMPMSSASSAIAMKAAAAPEPSVWADPIAGHGAELSMSDITWDPLGLASAENLEKYREAEIKHGRLAMLAALGWPAAEELEPFLAKLTGAADELIETGSCMHPLLCCHPATLAARVDPLAFRLLCSQRALLARC